MNQRMILVKESARRIQAKLENLKIGMLECNVQIFHLPPKGQMLEVYLGYHEPQEHTEIIARVPQLLYENHLYKRNDNEKLQPLVDFWHEHISPAILDYAIKEDTLHTRCTATYAMFDEI